MFTRCGSLCSAVQFAAVHLRLNLYSIHSTQVQSGAKHWGGPGSVLSEILMCRSIDTSILALLSPQYTQYMYPAWLAVVAF